jgi:HJR/Mrr/RecB family endonuclease
MTVEGLPRTTHTQQDFRRENVPDFLPSMSTPAQEIATAQATKPPVDAASIAAMSGTEFQALVATLLQKMGFTVTLTKASHDGGIDIVAECDAPMMRGKYIIQCKRYDGSVGEPFVCDLYGVMTAERANKGILITNSAFTASAVEFATSRGASWLDVDNSLISQASAIENAARQWL